MIPWLRSLFPLRSVLTLLLLCGGLAAGAACVLAPPVNPCAGQISLLASTISTAVLIALCLAPALWLVRAAESPGIAWSTIGLLVLGTPLFDGLTGGWSLGGILAFGLGTLVLVSLGHMQDRTSLAVLAVAGLAGGLASGVAPAAVGLVVALVVLVTATRRDGWRRVSLSLVVVLGSAACGACLMLLAARAAPPALEPLGAPLVRGGPLALTEALFASPIGVLYHSPLLWVAALGSLLALRRQRSLGLALSAAWASSLVTLALVGRDPVFACALLPLLAPGLARALAVTVAQVRRRPIVPLAAGGLCLAAWNLGLMEEYRRGDIPRDDTVAFAEVCENGARLLNRSTGAPPAWPGSWYVHWRYGLPIDSVDGILGRRLFSSPEQRSVAIRVADGSPDCDLLLAGWSSPRPQEGHLCRRVLGKATLVLPLDRQVPIDIELTLAGRGVTTVAANGSPLAQLPAPSQFSTQRFRVGASAWRAPFNLLSIEVPTGDEACVESIVLTRREEPRR
jgi:hypothetical protein